MTTQPARKNQTEARLPANKNTSAKSKPRYGQPIGNRRLRSNSHVRELTRQVRVHHEELIQALFVVEGIQDRETIPGIPGTFRDTPDTLLTQIESDIEAGITKFLLFGVPSPDSKHSHEFDHSFTVSQIAAIKQRFGDDIWLAVDVCLCASTESGHCGILNDSMDHVLNPESTDALADMAVQYARAGADCIAPSDMMDGRVLAIRENLDDHGFDQTMIMSYSAKFASAFYGPFRLACDSAPGQDDVKLKDRKTYQLDYTRPQDALSCSWRDYEEGADILMVKPVIHYLDILKTLTDEIPAPFAVYYVSGEHASIEAAAEKGLINAAEGHVEAWHAIKRAGASMIITYAARNGKEWLGT